MAEPSCVVVGAGPAGLRAAETLADAGLRPVLVDEAEAAGGQIYRQPPAGAARAAKALYGWEAGKATALHRLAQGLRSRVDYRARTLVHGLADGDLDLLGPEGHAALPFDRLILATGAVDRVLPFPGWTLPGVFTLGAAQVALKAQGMAIGQRVALVGAGPLLPLVATQYLKAGVALAAVLDVTPFAAKVRAAPRLAAEVPTLTKGLWYTLRTALAGQPIAGGVRALRVEGGDRVTGLAYVDARGRERRVACDAVGASFGLRSETQLADLAGCRFRFDDTVRQWLPERTPEGRSSVPAVYLAGDGAGIGGADAAELSGVRAAFSLLADIGRAPDATRVADLDRRLARQRRFRAALEAAYPFPHALVDAIGDDEIVCRCEGVDAGTLRRAARERDAHEINRLKAFTRVGMGRCQGRMCALAAAEILARALDRPVESVGRLRGQPPVKPIPMGAVA